METQSTSSAFWSICIYYVLSMSISPPPLQYSSPLKNSSRSIPAKQNTWLNPNACCIDQHRTIFGSDIITIFHFHVEFDHKSVKKIPTYFLSYSAENSAIAYIDVPESIILRATSWKSAANGFWSCTAWFLQDSKTKWFWSYNTHAGINYRQHKQTLEPCRYIVCQLNRMTYIYSLYLATEQRKDRGGYQSTSYIHLY